MKREVHKDEKLILIADRIIRPICACNIQVIVCVQSASSRLLNKMSVL